MNNTPPCRTPGLIGAGVLLVLVLVADLITKSAVFTMEHLSQRGLIVQHVNPGIAWGLFGDWQVAVAMMTVLVIPLLVVAWWFWLRHEGRGLNWAFGGIIGGALGNGYDRIMAALGRLGTMPAGSPHAGQEIDGVRDFIHVDIGIWPINPWPTFNVADAAISIGAVVMMWYMLRSPQSVSSGTSACPDAPKASDGGGQEQHREDRSDHP